MVESRLNSSYVDENARYFMNLKN